MLLIGFAGFGFLLISIIHTFTYGSRSFGNLIIFFDFVSEIFIIR